LSYEKVGDVLVAQDNLTEALKAYQAGLTISERLGKKADTDHAGIVLPYDPRQRLPPVSLTATALDHGDRHVGQPRGRPFENEGAPARTQNDFQAFDLSQ
jgi:hypothetical protein